MVRTTVRHWQTSNSNLCILNFRVRKGTTFNAFIRNMSWLEPRPGHWLFWLSFKWFSSVSIKKHSEVHLRIKNCSSTNLLKIYQFSYNFAPYMPVWVTAWLSKHKTKYSQSFRPLILLVTIYTSCTVNMKDYTIIRRKSTYLPVTVNTVRTVHFVTAISVINCTCTNYVHRTSAHLPHVSAHLMCFGISHVPKQPALSVTITGPPKWSTA